jgi:hypothetical protein
MAQVAGWMVAPRTQGPERSTVVRWRGCADLVGVIETHLTSSDAVRLAAAFRIRWTQARQRVRDYRAVTPSRSRP